MWDISFLLLTRLRMVYIDLQIEKLAVLNTTVAESNSVFYRWNVYVSQHLDERKPIKVDESLKLNFAQKFADLKHGQCYWDQTWNFNDLIDTIPIVGEMILDEIHSKVITMPPVPNIEPLMHPISQILLSYTKFTSMILCIVEWLSTQKCDPDRQIFVKCIIALFTTEHAVKADFPQWLELMLITRPILHELLEEANPPEMPYPWIVQCARRALPSIRRTAAPDMQQLKDAYLYACRQNWASPNVISLVDKCDRNESIWCKVWFCQMRKSVTLDELTANSEICMAAAFCAPIPFFIHFAQNIVDHVLQQDNYNSAVGTPLSIVLGQMLMRLLILSIWANKQRYLAVLKKLGKTPPMRQQFQPGELFIGDNVPPKLDDFADDKVRNDDGSPEADHLLYHPLCHRTRHRARQRVSAGPGGENPDAANLLPGPHRPPCDDHRRVPDVVP
ncbi:hypothetical protein L596_018434 [Steinernema carpocapsae]|uniref:Mediator of RNA polymerase II transcription subunit 23 n=1 Tax=Steinernema carpocapsae TaxID=34508 RepID=A0A4U5N5F4_STECR|nr:hypothetical protein L596_018434 [Steinernema carpocapsae]